MENNPLLDISRISGRRGSKSAGRFLTRIKQMIQLKGKVRGGAMQDILSERHLKISTFRRRKPGVQPFWQLPSSQTLQDKWLPSFSQNVDAFFNTSSASWASRNSRLRRAISFCSYSMMKMYFFCGRKT